MTLHIVFDEYGAPEGISQGSPIEGSYTVNNLSITEAIKRIRLIDNRVEDILSNTSFYIDAAGIKHAVPAPGRQEVNCSYDDVLINDTGAWRIKTVEDKLSDAKRSAIEEMAKFANKLTTTQLDKYPLSEQLSFSDRLAEARIVEGGGTLPPESILSILSLKTGTPVNEIATGVIQKANEFNAITASVTSIRSLGEAQIEAATAISELADILQSLRAQAKAEAVNLNLL